MSYDLLMYVGLGLGFVFLAASVVLFFRLDILDALGELTGRTARKSIAAIRSKDGKTQRNAQKRGVAGLIGMSRQRTDIIRKDESSELTEVYSRPAERDGEDTRRITDIVG